MYSSSFSVVVKDVCGIGVGVCSDNVEDCMYCTRVLIWSSVVGVGVSVYVMWRFTLQSCIPRVCLTVVNINLCSYLINTKNYLLSERIIKSVRTSTKTRRVILY